MMGLSLTSQIDQFACGVVVHPDDIEPAPVLPRRDIVSQQVSGILSGLPADHPSAFPVWVAFGSALWFLLLPRTLPLFPRMAGHYGAPAIFSSIRKRHSFSFAPLDSVPSCFWLFVSSLCHIDEPI